MKARVPPRRRKRAPRSLLLLLLLLLLLPLAWVNWNGLVDWFTGGDADGKGGRNEAARLTGLRDAAGPSVDWSAVREKVAEAAQRGASAAEAASLSETWRALTSALDASISAGDLGSARRALQRARSGWAAEAPSCATALGELEAQVESAARSAREMELPRLRAALAAGRFEEVRRSALALLRSGDELAFEEACRCACEARGAEAPVGAEERARTQAMAWKRAMAGLAGDVLRDELLTLATRCAEPAEAVGTARLAHELARCAYPARRVQEDLEGQGLEVRWSSGGADAVATIRSRGGVLEVRPPAEESFQPLRALDAPVLVALARELFEPLGLEPEDARTALAALLARSGERDTARMLLASQPAMEDAERARFLDTLGA